MINRQRDTIFAPNIKMLVDKYLKTLAQGSNVEVLTNEFSYKFFLWIYIFLIITMMHMFLDAFYKNFLGIFYSTLLVDN